MTALLDTSLKVWQELRVDGSTDRIVVLEAFPKGRIPWAGFANRNACRVTEDNTIVWRAEPIGTPPGSLTMSPNNYILAIEVKNDSILLFRLEGDVYVLDPSSGVATFKRWNMK